MHKLAPKQLLALTVALTMGQTYAAAPSAVGLAMAKSSIRIDTSTVAGNATLLSGSVVESVGGTSELRLRNGSVVMDTNARVKVFENRAELESGKIQIQGSQLEAGSGQIRVMADPGAEAILERRNSSVVVGSLRGAVRVVNRDGVLLASLNPGNALAFDTEEQGGAGTGNGTTPEKKSSKKKKAGAAGAAGGWGALGAGAQAAVIVGVAAAVVVPTAVVTTRNTKAASSK